MFFKFLFFFIIFLNFAFSINEIDAYVKLNITSQIEIVTDNPIFDFSMLLFIPQNNSFQNVKNYLSNKNFNIITINNITYANISIKDIEKNEKIYFTTIISRNEEDIGIEKQQTNIKKEKIDEIDDYLFEKNFSYSDDFELALILLKQVNQYLEYNLAYADVENDALTTFREKKGTCDEFSKLYIYFLNYFNISSFEVVGLMKGNNDFEFHSFVRLCIKEICFFADPTNLEFYNLGAYTILYYYLDDKQKEQNIFYSYLNDVPNVQIRKNETVNIIDFKKREELTKIDVDFDVKIEENMETIIRINNRRKTPFFPKISLVSTDEIGGILFDDIIYLKPNKEKNITIKKEIDFEFKEGFIYEIPFSLDINGFRFEKIITKQKEQEKNYLIDKQKILNEDNVCLFPLVFLIFVFIIYKGQKK